MSAGLACAVTVGALSPAPPRTVAAVVTARDVAAGAELTSRDVRVARVPPDAVPDGALTSAARARGHTAAATLAAGTIVTPGLVSGDTSARSAPDGRVVVALPAGDDPTAALLGPGAHVDLLASTADGSRYLARRALVLPSPRPASGSGGLLGGGATPVAATLVVAVEPSEAKALAARADGSRLTTVVVR
jgi:Flp pilus assembly protein CpaB